MAQLRRLILVRHGETTEGSIDRMIGAGDPALSAVGIQQMRAAAKALGTQAVDGIVASSQRRAWQAAQRMAPGQTIRLETDLREIHFGRWEGKKVSEIEGSDPVLYRAWQDGSEGFEYPGGELRSEFRSRVERGLRRILDTDATSVLIVTHKGVIRTMAELLTGSAMDRAEPPLAGVVLLTHGAKGWFLGQTSSDPASGAA